MTLTWFVFGCFCFVLFFSVCCSASNVYSHSWWQSTPTMHCMDHHVSFFTVSWCQQEEKQTKKKRVRRFFLSFFLSVFLWFGVSLMFGVLLFQVWRVVTDAQHAFHRQSHLCKWQNLNALLLPRAFMVYRRDSDAWKNRRTACKERERESLSQICTRDQDRGSENCT